MKDKRHGYPYHIPSIDHTKIQSKVRRIEANQFLLIETLLRTPEILDLYGRSKKEFESYWRNYHGIFSHDPLGGSHHCLLFGPDKELKEKLLQMGYLDTGLGVLDLGAVAKLEPGTVVRHGSIVLQGPMYGGAEECRIRLQGQDPRFLHLRIDISHPPSAIIESLRDLLEDRHNAIKEPLPNAAEPKAQINATPKKEIVTKLEYFRCYDLQQEGKRVEEIADIMSKERGDVAGYGVEYTTKALARVRRMIKDVQTSTRHLPPLS